MSAGWPSSAVACPSLFSHASSHSPADREAASGTKPKDHCTPPDHSLSLTGMERDTMASGRRFLRAFPKSSSSIFQSVSTGGRT